jgi:hypothetical protein
VPPADVANPPRAVTRAHHVRPARGASWDHRARARTRVGDTP